MMSNTCDNYADDNMIGYLSDNIQCRNNKITEVNRRIVKLVRVKLYASQSK